MSMIYLIERDGNNEESRKMTMRRHLMAATTFCLLIPSALAQQADDVLVFGDSLPDPGNIPDLSGGVNFPPSSRYADNRFSNGPVFSELLPGLLGRRFDPALNCATGGALTGEDNLNSDRSSPSPRSAIATSISKAV